MSAESHLAGLYPPTSNQTWNGDLPWQPIPVHTIPRDDGNLILSFLLASVNHFLMIVVL